MGVMTEVGVRGAQEGHVRKGQSGKPQYLPAHPDLWIRQTQKNGTDDLDTANYAPVKVRLHDGHEQNQAVPTDA